MGKIAIRVIGVLFFLWGLIYIIDFLWTGRQPSTLIRFVFANVDIAGYIFVVLLLITGFGIIKLKNSSRIWGLIILWMYFLASFAVLFISVINLTNPRLGPEIGLDWRIDFKGTDYGLSRDYTLANPWFLLALSISFTIFIGAQIYILSSKKNRSFFTAENRTGS